jgi:hypothetical protein
MYPGAWPTTRSEGRPPFQLDHDQIVRGCVAAEKSSRPTRVESWWPTSPVSDSHSSSGPSPVDSVPGAYQELLEERLECELEWRRRIDRVGRAIDFRVVVWSYGRGGCHQLPQMNSRERLASQA